MIVLDSTAEVVRHARHVSIDDEAVARWAEGVTLEQLQPRGHYLPANLPGNQAQLANLVLLIDALNFCFWSDRPIQAQWRGKTYHRFEALFVSLMLAAGREKRWFEPTYWLEVQEEELERILAGQGELLLLDDRVRIVRETARIVIDRFDGQFMNAIESVASRAWPLAVLLMTEFDSFRDVANYHGHIVYFMKRAQICALDLSVAWQTHEFGALAGLEELTAFADYRVPQALRRLGLLRYSPGLAERIDRGEEITSQSDEEIEIRAGTVQAVERLQKALLSMNKRVATWQIDWYLWEAARGSAGGANHHRTRTVYY